MSRSPQSEAAAAFRRGLAHHQAGETSQAFSAFLMALALHPAEPAHRRMALQYLGLASGYKTLPQAVTAALAVCASDPDLDPQPLSLVVKNLLENDARLDQALRFADGAGLEDSLRAGAFDWLFDDPLPRAVLARALNISLPLERLMTALRRHACLRITANSATALLTRPTARVFFAVMAVQNQTARQAWAATPGELEALRSIRARHDVNAAMVKAAYVALTELPNETVAQLPSLLRNIRTQAGREKALALSLPEFAPIAGAVSRAVADQYAAFPYPPWRQIMAAEPKPLSDILHGRAPYLNFAASLNGPVEVLSAGCGTGYGAAALAKNIQGAQVTAVDLSRTSLGFAARKAEELKLGNITFGAADILGLADAQPEWRGKFHLIECSGVLHHMADPAAGLAALKPLLHADGVMKLAFYSERGRGAVVAARALVRERGFAHTPDGVRAARAAIMTLESAHPARGVMQAPEFFSLDGLHDLIFNVQEHRYHPRDLKRLLAGASLTVFAVDLANPTWRSMFAARHPAPNAAADLDLWDAFEAEHPDTFAEMIQVWCRP